MFRHWFLTHAPCTSVYAVLGMLYCDIATFYDSSENVRTDFYFMFHPDSYYVLNAAIPYGIFICFKHCNVSCARSVMFA